MNNESAVQVNGIWANALASGPGPVAIIQLSDLKIVFANYLFEHYFGYAHDDILTGGVYFTSLIQEYEHDRFRYQLLSVIDSVSGRSTHSMYSLISKSGTIHSPWQHRGITRLYAEQNPKALLVRNRAWA